MTRLQQARGRARDTPAAEAATPGGRRRRGRATVVIVLLAAGLVALGLYALFGVSAPRASGVTRAAPERPVVTLSAGAEVCQTAALPAGTGAVHVLTAGTASPDGLSLTMRGDPGGLLATSRRVAARDRGVRFALDRAVARDGSVSICLRSGADRPIPLLGDDSGGGLTRAGRPVPGTLALIFYRPGEESLASLAGLVAERAGRLRGAFGGPWRGAAIVALVLLAIAATIGVGLAAGGERSLRALAGGLAAVAICNALAWSLLTPALQIPDEQAHLSYVQDLVEKGRPPQPFGPSLSPQLATLVEVSDLGHVNFHTDARPPWTATLDAAAEQRIEANPDRVNPASFLAVADYPPAYYAAMAPVYRLGTAAEGNTLDVLTPLRAASALLAGAAVLAVLAFLLELFPERRRLALVVALICAWHPVFTWISGGVNPDALLIPVGCTMFWLFARAFRRGLTPLVAAGLGLTLALALLTKVAALGLLPGWIIGVALLAWRERSRLRLAGVAVLTAAAPVGAYAALNVALWARPAIPQALTGSGAAEPSTPVAQAAHTSGSGFATYLWEYALPRLPAMHDYFNSSWVPKDLWVPIWFGRFGWSDYQFPVFVNRVALLVYAAIAVAALVGLVRWLRVRREPRVPVAVFAVLALGLIVVIARVGYPLRASGSFIFEQGRYYMPLIPLYALALALGALALPRRWGRVALVAFLCGSVLHLGAAMGLTVKRYYTFSGFHATESSAR